MVVLPVPLRLPGMKRLHRGQIHKNRPQCKCTIDQEGCMRVLEGMGKEKPGKKPFRTLASMLNALPLVESV